MRWMTVTRHEVRQSSGISGYSVHMSDLQEPTGTNQYLADLTCIQVARVRYMYLMLPWQGSGSRPTGNVTVTYSRE